MRGFRTGRIVDGLCVLALEVWGENRMDRAAVNMTRIPVMMIGFGMDMEERDHEHPCGQPEHGKYTNSRHAQHPPLLKLYTFGEIQATPLGSQEQVSTPLVVVGPGNPKHEPVLGCHTSRHEREDSGLQETSFAVLILC